MPCSSVLLLSLFSSLSFFATGGICSFLLSQGADYTIISHELDMALMPDLCILPGIRLISIQEQCTSCTCQPETINFDVRVFQISFKRKLLCRFSCNNVASVGLSTAFILLFLRLVGEGICGGSVVF